MMTLVSGGAGSGKSALAEVLTFRSPAAQRVYLATMRVWSEEDQQRVERHRAQRRDKGFLTIEQATGLSGVDLPPDCAVLLEDLGNLTANECFEGAGFDGAETRILTDLSALAEKSRDLIIVTNELFSDGTSYPSETERYLTLLGKLNQSLAQRCDRVLEVVAGLPIVWKGVLV